MLRVLYIVLACWFVRGSTVSGHTSENKTQSIQDLEHQIRVENSGFVQNEGCEKSSCPNNEITIHYSKASEVVEMSLQHKQRERGPVPAGVRKEILRCRWRRDDMGATLRWKSDSL